MKRIDRYILRQLFTATLLVAVTLTGVVWLTQSLRFVEMIINRGLSAPLFVYFTMLLLPTFLGVILPIALFIAVLFVYNRLTTDSELVVLRAGGCSHLFLARPAILLAGVITLVCYGFTLYGIPASFREFKDLQYTLRDSYPTVLLQEGVFSNVMKGVTVYVRSRSDDGELAGIIVHDARNPERPVTMMAERGALVSTADGPRFLMEQGNRQEIDHAAGQLSTLHFDSYALDLSQFVQRDDNPWLEANERYLHELFEPGTSPDDLNNADQFLAEAHDRLVSPLYSLAFAMIALATMMSGQFHRRGYGWRVSAGLAAGVLVRLAGVGLTNIAAKAPTLIPLMYLNVAAAIGVSIYLLARRRRLPAARMAESAG